MTHAISDTLDVQRRPAEHPSHMPLRIASTTLVVNDMARVSDWYQSVLGFSVRQNADDRIVLGTATADLLTLVSDPDALRSTRSTPGLFHNAFLVPSRADLAAWFAHAVSLNVQIAGASDHGVSEAIYLSDPEGNGIEVYRDRPRDAWARGGDGLIDFDSAALDLQALFAEAGSRRWSGVADNTAFGHLHLKVDAIAKARQFFVGHLGFDVQSTMASAEFYGAGGYHHHLAANTWGARAHDTRPKRMTGLSEYTLEVATEADMTQVAARLATYEGAVSSSDSTLLVEDPWGMRVRVQTQP